MAEGGHAIVETDVFNGLAIFSFSTVVPVTCTFRPVCRQRSDDKITECRTSLRDAVFPPADHIPFREPAQRCGSLTRS